MSVDSALNHTLYGSALRELVERGSIDGLAVVALHLLSERSALAPSLWAPYIAALPATYNSLTHWTDQQRALLTGTTALGYWEQSVRPRHASFLRAMEHSARVYPGLFSFSADDLDWAFSTIATRAWDFEHSPALIAVLRVSSSPHLIPLADMVRSVSQSLTMLR